MKHSVHITPGGRVYVNPVKRLKRMVEKAGEVQKARVQDQKSPENNDKGRKDSQS